MTPSPLPQGIPDSVVEKARKALVAKYKEFWPGQWPAKPEAEALARAAIEAVLPDLLSARDAAIKPSETDEEVAREALVLWMADEDAAPLEITPDDCDRLVQVFSAALSRRAAVERARLTGNLCLICGLTDKQLCPQRFDEPCPCTFDPNPIDAAKAFLQRAETAETMLKEARIALRFYADTMPLAFRSKPVGAPDSPERRAQEEHIAAEDKARMVLASAAIRTRREES